MRSTGRLRGLADTVWMVIKRYDSPEADYFVTVGPFEDEAAARSYVKWIHELDPVLPWNGTYVPLAEVGAILAVSPSEAWSEWKTVG